VVPSAFIFCVALLFTDLRQQKTAMRALMQAQRDALPQSLRDGGAQKLVAQFQQHVALPAAAVVSGYIALNHEIDPAPLLQSLHDAGHPLALPVMQGKQLPLCFRSYRPGQKLLNNGLGIPEPDAQSAAIEPDILLVPLLAFDARCHRLGYGGGYYDRTIQALRQRKKINVFGLAFACQKVAAVPVGKYDVPLDGVITGDEIYG